MLFEFKTVKLPCRKHPRNRFVSANNLSKEEWEARLNNIGETLFENTNA